MLGDLQQTLQPYLSYFGAYPWIQALVTIIVSFTVAWIFDRFVIKLFKKLASIRSSLSRRTI